MPQLNRLVRDLRHSDGAWRQTPQIPILIQEEAMRGGDARFRRWLLREFPQSREHSTQLGYAIQVRGRSGELRVGPFVIIDVGSRHMEKPEPHQRREGVILPVVTVR